METSLSPQRLDRVLVEHDRDLFFKLSDVERQNAVMFDYRCRFLSWQTCDSSDTPKAQVEMAQLNRLLCLDNELIGQFAVERLEHLIARKERIAFPLATMPVRLSANKGRVVTLDKQTFAQCIAANGWIVIPHQSLHVETLSADTFNCVWGFPAPRYRNFVHFARSYGFCSVNDRDKHNKNIFHYFFGAVVYCWLAADIAKTAFSAGEERLPGNYTLAMSQQVMNGTPSGFTPCMSSQPRKASTPSRPRLSRTSSTPTSSRLMHSANRKTIR